MSKNKFHDINYYLKKYPTQNGFQIPNIIDDLHIGTNLREAIDNTPIGHQESKDYQVAKALEILSCCNPNHEAKDFKRVGLVVGKVQSGKTTNFSLLSAAAADHGYNLIVHLLGTENLLKDENLRDVKDILGIKHSSTGNWRLNEMKSKSAGKGRKIGLTPKNLHSLLKKGQPAIFMEQDEKVIYIPMLKNHSHIEDLAVLFEKAQLKHHKDVLTLIIDDEVDSASINIAKPDQLPSSTNSKLKRLFDAAGRCTYVGYTATSAAVKLSHVDSWLSPDFHIVMKPGNGYIGNKELFGEPEQLADSKIIKNKKHQIKLIDVKQVTDPSGNLVDSKEELKDSMIEAVCDYLISYAFLADRWRASNKKGPVSMMIHPTSETGRAGSKAGILSHREAVKHLKDFLENFILTDLKNTSSKTYQLMNKIYNQKKKNARQKNLVPSFKNIIDRYIQFFGSNRKDWELQAVNGDNKQTESAPDINWGNAQLWFLVGGKKMSRGLVVKNLLTTWMPIEPITAVMDTMEQRGRFFGYKDDYVDLISIYLKQETIETFKHYLVFERQQWAELEDTIFEGIPLKESDPSYIGYDNYSQITASNKKKRKLPIIRRGWIFAKHISFEEKNGLIQKNFEFNDFMDGYINDLETKNILKWVPQNNRFRSKRDFLSGFKHTTLPIQDAYSFLLEPLMDPNVNKTKDDDFLSAVRHIRESLLEDSSKGIPKNIDCDIIYFDSRSANEKKRTVGKKGRKGNFSSNSISKNSKGHYYWPNYAQGPKCSSKSLKKHVGRYVGDNRVLLSNNVDPTSYDQDLKNNNERLTIQIHKFAEVGVADHNQTTLKDVYAIRMMLPKF